MTGTHREDGKEHMLSTVVLVLGIMSKLVCGGCGDSAPTLDSIAVNPAAASVPKGLTDQMSAVGTFSDGSIKDVTSQVQWSSSNTSAANISNDASSIGLLSSVSQGSVVISASLDGLNASTQIVVGDPSLVVLTVNAPAAAIVLGAGEQFTALGTYSDGSTQDVSAQVTWSSSNLSIATISNDAASLGQLTTLASGSVDITATLNGLSATDALTIS